jgi:hypothetical protein
VVVVVNGKRQVVARARFECRDVAGLRKWFEELGPFRLAVEATATYEWLFLLIEDVLAPAMTWITGTLPGRRRHPECVPVWVSHTHLIHAPRSLRRRLGNADPLPVPLLVEGV